MFCLKHISSCLLLLCVSYYRVSAFQLAVQPIRLNPVHQVARLGRNSDKSGQLLQKRQEFTKLGFSLRPFVNTISSSVLRNSGPVPLLHAFGVNVALFAILGDKLSKSLTPAGVLHSMALGTGLWHSLGWKGWTVCVLYLVMGNLVTKVRFAEKEKNGLAEGRGGRRGPENVWGSAATGLACAIIASRYVSFHGVSSNLWVLGYVSSIATKIADTFASEIGKAYGKTTFLITTLKRVPPGTEGAVSLEGTIAAAFGGLTLSLYAYYIGLITGTQVAVSTASAFVATNIESVLGATIQEKKGLGWVTNEFINFLNTLIGAGMAISIAKYALGMR